MHHAHAASRKEEPEAGFTLIELMVVVLIIAILIAVMIPTFVGARHRAQDRAAQSSLHNGLTAAKVVFSDKADYTLATVPTLTTLEPGLAWVDSATASTGPNSVSADPVSANYIVLAAQSKSGGYFFVFGRREASAGVGAPSTPRGAGSCSGSAPAVAVTLGWRTRLGESR